MVNVSNYGYNKNFLADAMNRNGARTQSNTRSESYNCGGFALGTFSWYYPYGSDIVDYAYDHGFINEAQKEEIYADVDRESYEWEEEDFLCDFNGSKKTCDVIPTYEVWKSMAIQDCLECCVPSIFNRNSGFMEYFIDKMLKEIPKLRVINDFSDLKENEYCVAFRVGHGDFHYIRSNNSKCDVWIGKMGWNRVKRIDEEVSTDNLEEFFDVLFGMRYDSDTILFAKEAA